MCPENLHPRTSHMHIRTHFCSGVVVACDFVLLFKVMWVLINAVLFEVGNPLVGLLFFAVVIVVLMWCVASYFLCFFCACWSLCVDVHLCILSYAIGNPFSSPSLCVLLCLHRLHDIYLCVLSSCANGNAFPCLLLLLFLLCAPSSSHSSTLSVVSLHFLTPAPTVDSESLSLDSNRVHCLMFFHRMRVHAGWTGDGVCTICVVFVRELWCPHCE